MTAASMKMHQNAPMADPLKEERKNERNSWKPDKLHWSVVQYLKKKAISSSCNMSPTPASHTATDRSEEPQLTAFPPTHTLSLLPFLHFQQWFQLEINSTWSTQTPDHDIHSLHLGATQLSAIALEPMSLYNSKGAGSSMPTTVRQTETGWSSGCQVLLTVCLANPAGF